MNGKWTFNESEDGYWGHDLFDTKENAAEAAIEYLCEEQPIMYIGRCKSVPLPTYVDVDSILEHLDEQYAEECPDGCADFLFGDVKLKDYQWLEVQLQDIIKKFYQRTGIKGSQFFIVNVEKIRWEKGRGCRGN